MAIDEILSAPEIVKDHLGADFCAIKVAKFVSCGAFESAALEMIGARAAFMLSRGEDSSMATVVLPGMVSDVTAEGPTPGIALLAGYLLAIQSLPCFTNSFLAPPVGLPSHLH